MALVGATAMPVHAQHWSGTSHPASPTNWQLDISASDEAVGLGLPVLVLDRPDWPDFRSGAPPTARA